MRRVITVIRPSLRTLCAWSTPIRLPPAAILSSPPSTSSCCLPASTIHRSLATSKRTADPGPAVVNAFDETSQPLDPASLPHINWFPGHMHKAIKELQPKLQGVQVVLEVRDARVCRPHTMMARRSSDLTHVWWR